MYKFLILMALALCAGAETGVASEYPLAPDDPFQMLNLSENAEYLEDTRGIFSMEDVVKRDVAWKRNTTGSMNFGFTGSAYWIRFTMENPGSHPRLRYIEISYPMIDQVEFFPPAGNPLVSGDMYPFSSRPIADRNFIFPVNLASGKNIIHLRLKTTSSLNFSIYAWEPVTFLKRLNRELPFFWIYYGIMIVMALYNLLLFFSVRTFKYIYYSLFIASMTLFHLTLNGFAFQYLWPASPWWANKSLLVFMCANITTSSLFIRSYVETGKNFPFIDKLILYSVSVPSLVLCLWSLYPGYKTGILVVLAFNIYAVIVLYATGVIAWLNHIKQGRYILIGFTLFFVGFFLYSLKTYGLIPSAFFTEWGIQIGSACIVILFSLGLADEINTMRLDLYDLNLDLKKNRDELRELTGSLEERVGERTRELNKALNEVELVNRYLQESNVNLKRTKEIAERDMHMAANVQRSFLPLEAPQSDSWDVAYTFKPMVQVSGDFYDFYIIDKKLRGLGIFDVSGHGIASGLITMIARSMIFRSFSRGIDHPDFNVVLEDGNRNLIEELEGVNNYLTGVLLRFRDGLVDYVNAGHPDILLRKAGGEVGSFEGGGENIRGNYLGIAAMEDRYRCVSRPVNPGDFLLLYTDSLVETIIGGSDEQYGHGRLTKAFGEAPQGTADDVLNYILNHFYSVVGRQELDDDLTVIVVKRL